MSNGIYTAYEPDTLQRLHDVQVQMLKDILRVCDKYSIPCFLIYGTAIGAVRHGGFIPWDDDIDVGMLREDFDKFCEIFPRELNSEYELLTPLIDNRYACTVCHVQKKGTTFISEVSKDLKCHLGIFMDIFPFDAVPDTHEDQKKILRKTTFYGKLLFLSGTGNPHIPYTGIIYHILHFGCLLIHFLLKIFQITPDKLYKKFLKACTLYNNRQCEYVTSYEYTGSIKDKIKKEELFPLQKVPFESIEAYIPKNNDEFLTKVYGEYMKVPPESKRINHAPLVITFEDSMD